MNKVALYLLLLLCTVAQHCGADMILHHPKHVDMLRAEYNTFPSRGKSVRVDVYELNSELWIRNTKLTQDYSIIGETFYGPLPIKPEVYVRELENKEDVKLTFAHEYGHVMYFYELSKAERDDWDRWWANNKNLQPRWYGEINSYEGFAEAFMATYMKNPIWNIAWGFPPGYVPDAALTAKIRAYFSGK